MTDKDIIKAWDILCKLDFFNQRAGYEHWIGMPKNVQDKDLEDTEKDIKFLKDLIMQLHAEIEWYRKNLNTNIVVVGSRGCGKSLYQMNQIELRIDKIQADAIKEFAERLKKKTYPFPCAIGVENAVTIRAIDDLVKGMVGEE